MKRGPYKTRGVSKDRPAYYKRYYAERIAAGICTCCGGKNETRPGKSQCEECRTKNNNKQRKKTYE